MCTKYQHIRSSGMYHPQSAFIPCGKCFDCRKRENNSWLFRLKAEIESLPKSEWYAVFCTLTYNDKHLPRIPRILLKNKKDSSDFCFSKSDVREFSEKVRKFLELKGAKDEKRSRWLIASEFGESTHRPHYHMLWIVPSFIDSSELFTFVKQIWCNKGFVFPKEFEGGIDSHGYQHKPFVVDDLPKTCKYVSKYISKDIAYMSNIDISKYKKCIILNHAGKFVVKYYRYRGVLRSVVKINNGRKVKKDEKIRLSDYLPFHMQSRSLGKTFCENLLKKGDKCVLDFLENGHFFDYESFARPAPRYIVNRLTLKVRYGKKQDKRVVRYYSSSFLENNYREIFKNKIENLVKRIEHFKKMSRNRLFEICRDYVAYFGVVDKFWLKEPSESWLKRYEVDSFFEDGKEVFITNFPEEQISDKQKEEIYDNLKIYMQIMKMVDSRELENAKIMESNERLKNYIIDALTSSEV